MALGIFGFYDQIKLAVQDLVLESSAFQLEKTMIAAQNAHALY